MSEKQNIDVNGWVGNPADLSSFNAFGVVTLSDGQQVSVQLTGRHGLDGEKLYEDFKRFVAFLDLAARDSAVKFGKAESMAVAGSKPAGESEKKERRYDQPLTQAELPAELAEITVDVYQQDFDFIVVKPELDDKATVEFYSDNPKLTFPVGARINKWKHETVKDALVDLGIEGLDPSKPGKYRVGGVQYWKQGAAYTNKKGQPAHYSDLILVKAVF